MFGNGLMDGLEVIVGVSWNCGGGIINKGEEGMINVEGFNWVCQPEGISRTLIGMEYT